MPISASVNRSWMMRVCALVLCAYVAAVQALPIPSPPRLGSASWLLADAASGRILVEKNIDIKLAPASLTKIMTSYVLAHEVKQGRASLDDVAAISASVMREGSTMFLEPGSSVRLEDLLKGVIIQSGNDASVALAEYIAGDESSFAELMNFYAKDLGMENTHFLNVTGLPVDNHITTTRDMWLLTRSLIQDFPEHYKLYAKKSFTYGRDHRTGEPIMQRNRNRMLWRDPSVDGVKTGYTEASGFCLVTSAKRNGMRLISVVMGASTDEARLQETQKLFAYGFRFFETVEVLEANQEIKPSPVVWGGKQQLLSIGVAESIFVTIPRGDKDKLVAELDLTADFWAPIEAGQNVGTLRTSLNDEVLSEVAVLAFATVPTSDVFSRLIDRIKFFFHEYKL